ncbi:MAG: hypothetical protein WBL93_11590 [Lutisporaceae bacterium]
MGNAYRENLIERVLEASENQYWDSAVLEWEIVDCDEDDTLSASCICGKEELRYLFTIQNAKNGNTLYPIGSSCIKKFEREDLNEKASIQEKLFKLYHAIIQFNYITLSAESFSRKLLKYLFENGVFKATKFNDFNPEVDYEFMLKMFNKRDKDTITTKQQRKINAIIMTSIRPYLVEQLREKIK